MTGGNGGAGGVGAGGTGAAGPGGAGIVGAGLTIINSGTIAGGTAAGDGAQANAVTFTGGANTLTLQAGSVLGGNIAVTGSLDFSQATDATLSNAITGTGALSKSGSGTTLTLDGSVNTYSGATTVTAGTLALTNGASLSNSSLVTVASGATFDTSGNVGFTSIKALAGAGTVATGGGLYLSNASTEFSGAINGSGGVEVGAGTQTLSGVNGYTNTTQIDAGATLALKGNGSIASSASVTFSGAGTFDISQSNTGASINALVSFGNDGVVSLGGKTLTIASGSSFSGVIQDGGMGGGAGGSLAIGSGASQNLGGINTYTGTTTIGAGGTLALTGDGSIASSSGVFIGDLATFDIWAGTADKTIQGLSGGATASVVLGDNNLIVGSAGSTTFAGVIDGSGGAGGLVKQGTGTLTLTGINFYTGGTTIDAGLINFNSLGNFGSGTITLNGGGLQWAAGNTIDVSSRLVLANGGGIFDTNGNTVTLAGSFGGTGGITKAGAGILTLSGNNTYAGGTTVTGGLINFASAGNLGTGQIALNGGGLQWATGNTTDISARLAPLGAGGGTFDTNGNTVTLASAITGSGGLTKAGLGTLILGGTNSYSGGTTVSAGVLQGNTSSLQGNIVNNAAVVFNQTGSGTYAGSMSGAGSLAVQGGGTLTIGGTNTYSGPTTVSGSTLLLNGALASTVTLDSASTIGGSGTIGGLVSNGSTYVVNANAQGQASRLTVTGTAMLNGGTVQVIAASGSYGNSTTYTILNAQGGRTGTYSGVTSNFAFLTPSLSYDANNVFLTLALQGGTPFSGFGGNTANQRAVGAALDQSFTNASGDFATVIGALTGLNTQQGPSALNQISGQPYADFGTLNVANNALFMNALGQQMALARGGAGSGQRQALAEACEIEACDGTSPLSVWGSVLGGVGSVQGNGNSSTLTYNLGGAAAGIDYRIDPRFLVGLATGYTGGTQWVDSFMGKAWSNNVSVAAYASFTEANVYVDALAGYGYSNNQLQQYIVIPGLQPRQANGSTGANQFLGQVETGYKLALYAPAQATVTPFARFQASSINQAGFTEWGASSLNLTVAQQTTTSLRTTLGADLAGTIGPLLLGVRLGWLHEYADTSRPMTAAFAGAPTAGFTVYGASPQRDSAVIGFSANATLADNMAIYLRYDGEIASGADNHTLNLGLRYRW